MERGSQEVLSGTRQRSHRVNVHSVKVHLLLLKLLFVIQKLLRAPRQSMQAFLQIRGRCFEFEFLILAKLEFSTTSFRLF